MTFLTLQTDFAKKTMDTRTVWIAGGTNNKSAINEGYKVVYNKARQDNSISQILKTDKVAVTMVGKKGAMQSDFLQPVTVFFKSGSEYFEVDKDENPYRFIIEAGIYSIIFEDTPTFSVYIEYIKKVTTLSGDSDNPILPNEFDRDIVNYALIEYHREQRDWEEVSNCLQYAEGKILETIDQFWLE